MKRVITAKYKTGLIILFILILVFFVPEKTQGYEGFRVQPSRFILEIEPGTRITEAITVTNTSSQPIILRANFFDWDLDLNYEMQIYESGTLPVTLEGLLRFNPRIFTLNPGESQTVRFTINLPKEDNPFERRGIIFFEHEDKFEEGGIGATIKSMIGTTVYAVPAEQVFIFNVRDIQVFQTEDDDFITGVVTYNDSNRHIRYFIEYKLLNEKGILLEEDKTIERVVLPQENRVFMFPLNHKLQPGNYELILNFYFTDTRERLTNSFIFAVD